MIAAIVDGANMATSQFITIPMLKPVIIFVTIYRAIEALKMFALIYIMTEAARRCNGTHELSYLEVGFSSYKVGYASTIAVMMMSIIALLFSSWVYGRKTGAIK